MDEATSTYQHGDQEISQQAATYRLFGSLTKWASLMIAVTLVMLVLWFCIGAPFLGGFIPGMIVLAAGISFLRATPTRNHDA